MSGDVVERSPIVDRVRSADPWELALAASAVFLLGRAPVLFVRQVLVEHLGGPIAPIWQDDGLIRSVLLGIELAVALVAARRCREVRLRPHVLLLGLLALSVASVEWSVEPSVTQLRAMAFGLTAVVGWYLGTRFSLIQQLDIAVAGGAIGIVSSLVAVVVTPGRARMTNGVTSEWSGIYVNRNLLSLVVCATLVAIVLRWWSASTRHRVALALLAIGGAGLVVKSGGRTGPVAAAAALGVCVLAVLVRRAVLDRGVPRLGAAAVLTAAIGTSILVVSWARVTLLDLLGRTPTLTRRTGMWEIDRALIEVRPWRGWGLEAIWTHQPAIQFARERFFAYPYQAHNGYFEMALSLGRVGVVLLVALIVVTLVRSVALAWTDRSAAALWPLAVATFAVVANFSESLFVAHEVSWALFVSAGFAALQHRRVEISREPGGGGSPGSHAARPTPSGPT